MPSARRVFYERDADAACSEAGGRDDDDDDDDGDDDDDDDDGCLTARRNELACGGCGKRQSCAFPGFIGEAVTTVIIIHYRNKECEV